MSDFVRDTRLGSTVLLRLACGDRAVDITPLWWHTAWRVCLLQGAVGAVGAVGASEASEAGASPLVGAFVAPSSVGAVGAAPRAVGIYEDDGEDSGTRLVWFGVCFFSSFFFIIIILFCC